MPAHKENYAKIGFFVILGLALTVLAICISGAGTLNRNEFPAETYFAESITGLDNGSQVKYRGVPIGKVKRIGFVSTEYDLPPETNAPAVSNPRGGSRLVMVEMSLDPAKFLPYRHASPEAFLTGLVRHGMRIKLASQGITGLSYLEIDSASATDPEADRELVVTWKPHTFYIPSTPSTLAEIKSALERLANKLSELDIGRLGNELTGLIHDIRGKLAPIDTATISKETADLLAAVRKTATSIDAIASAPGMQKLPDDLAATLASLRSVTASLDRQLGPTLSDIQKTVNSLDTVVTNAGAHADTTLASFSQTAQTINRTAGSQQHAIAELVQNLRTASSSLNKLIDGLSANPSSLLYGRPPAPLPETKRP